MKNISLKIEKRNEKKSLTFFVKWTKKSAQVEKKTASCTSNFSCDFSPFDGWQRVNQLEMFHEKSYTQNIRY